MFDGDYGKWPKKINELIHIPRGLSIEERRYINEILTTNGLRVFISLRYLPYDPLKYQHMRKESLIKELQYCHLMILYQYQYA